MLKFIKGYAETIKNVQVYPIFSLLVFFLFFVAVLYYVKRMNKKQVDELSDLPLHDSVETDVLLQNNNS